MYTKTVFYLEPQEVEDLVFVVKDVCDRKDFDPTQKFQRTDMFWVSVHEPAADRKPGPWLFSVCIDPSWYMGTVEERTKNFTLSLQAEVEDRDVRVRLRERIEEYFKGTAEYIVQQNRVRDNILSRIDLAKSWLS